MPWPTGGPTFALARSLPLGVAVMIGLLAACTETPPASQRVPPQPIRQSTSALLAANSFPIPTPQPTPTPYPRLTVPPGTPRCHTAQLEVALVDNGAAAGSVADDFEMRNRSATACWVYGYVGFLLLDASGNPMPQTLSRDTHQFLGESDPPTQILLPPNTAPLGAGQGTGHAFFNIATDDVMCDVSYWQRIAALKIWPPDEYTALIIPARQPNGMGFVSCGQLSLNPLQIQPRPTFH